MQLWVISLDIHCIRQGQHHRTEAMLYNQRSRQVGTKDLAVARESHHYHKYNQQYIDSRLYRYHLEIIKTSFETSFWHHLDILSLDNISLWLHKSKSKSSKVSSFKTFDLSIALEDCWNLSEHCDLTTETEYLTEMDSAFPELFWC